MSTENIKAFLTEVSKDQALQGEFTKALEAENDRQAVTDLANSKGYEFSSDELWAEVQQQQSEVQKRQEAGELSDEELEAVAGGEVTVSLAITITFYGSLASGGYAGYQYATKKW